MLKLIKTLYQKPTYLLLTTSVGILFYILNAILVDAKHNLTILSHTNPFNLFRILGLIIIGLPSRIKMISVVSTIIIGIMLGILISLLTYRARSMHRPSGKRVGILSSVGIFLGVVAPACAACGIGLAPILGLSAFITLLPYEGLELSVLAIVLLIVAIYRVSQSLLRDTICKINGNKTDERRSYNGRTRKK